MTISREILTAALVAFKAERQKIDANIAEVEALLGGKTKEATSEPPSKRGRGKRSAAVRARMAQAQKDRWAKLKGEPVPEPVAPKTRRKMSAKARKAIGLATRKRWAAKKAAEKKVGKANA
jgi:hypothetical protein